MIQEKDNCIASACELITAPEFFRTRRLERIGLNAALLILLLCAPLASRADMISGSYTIPFTNSLNLWDLSGSYDDSLGNISLNYDLHMGPNGRLTGTGYMQYADDSGFLSGPLLVHALVHSVGDAVRVNLTLKLSATGQIDDAEVTLHTTATENLELDLINQELSGTGHARATVSSPGHGSHSESLPPFEIHTALPTEMTGAWNLTLNVSTNRTKYSGDAAITLSNGKSFPLLATGTYSPKTDVSRLLLRGTGTNNAISFSLTAASTNGQVVIQKLNGHALGQILRLQPGQ